MFHIHVIISGLFTPLSTHHPHLIDYWDPHCPGISFVVIKSTVPLFFSTVTPSNPNDYGWWYPPKNPNLCPTLLLGEFSCPTWVCLKIVYPYTQWFCWSLSLLNGHNWGYTPFLDISTNEESNQWPLCITGTSLKPWNEKAAGWSERRWRFLRTMPRCASKAWGNMCHSGGKRLVSVGKHTSGNEGFISWIYIYI